MTTKFSRRTFLKSSLVGGVGLSALGFDLTPVYAQTQSLKISRALFAVYLRTNVRTLENWEQGRAKPNAQAALLINLVKRYPDTVQRLATI